MHHFVLKSNKRPGGGAVHKRTDSPLRMLFMGKCPRNKIQTGLLLHVNTAIADREDKKGKRACGKNCVENGYDMLFGNMVLC